MNRLLCGYLVVALSGFGTERFFNLCAANRLRVWDLDSAGQELYFSILLKDFWRIRPLVRKAQVHVKIVGKRGLPFFLQRNRKRKLYAAGVGSFFLILFVMSQFIWNITIEGNRRFTDDALLDTLSQLDIRYGMPRRQVDCLLIEEELRSCYADITWVSAQVSGTRLMVRIKENEVMRGIPEKEDGPRDLVADRDGVISGIIVRRGKAQVKAGDEIRKGQVLISGIVPIYDDAMTLVKEERVRADGDIRARTAYHYEEKLPLLVTERQDTGRRRRGFGLRLGNASFVWLLPAPEGSHWELTRETGQLVLFGDFFLPVWGERIFGEEYVIYERNLGVEELEKQKERIHLQKIQDLTEKGVQIIENNVKIIEERSCWKIRGDMVLDEPVGVGQNIETAGAEDSRTPASQEAGRGD